MARWFNIGGPCNAADHYMLSATERLPDVASLIRKKQYFVVHAPRQCGKTTAFLSFANETNAKGDAVEVKTRKLYEKSHEKAYAQMAKYIDRLGLSEGWLVVVDADFSKPWEGKVLSEDLVQDGKAIHVVCC